MSTDPRVIKTDEHTITSGWIDVGHGHKVWYEQWGNPGAKTPILSFHGGPGGSFKQKYKYTFDPTIHQVIGFDQRGCGNSLPYGKTQHNRTEDLLADARAILEQLGVKKVHAYGASWGSTLAMLFTLQHPDMVESLFVAGTFTASRDEIAWVDTGVLRTHYPEVWERFVASVPEAYADRPAAYHYEVLQGKDRAAWPASAKALEDLEVPAMVTEWPGYTDIKSDAPEEYDFVPYRIYAWYLSHGCFLPDNDILSRAHHITVPTYIINGRYDMVCPPKTAYQLHKAIKGSKLYITYDNHSGGPQTQLVRKTLIDSVY